MKIHYNNEEFDAYPLIMRRVFAEDILRGTKAVEFRSFTSKYVDMFCTPEAAELIKTDKKWSRKIDKIEKIFKDTDAIHFYNYNNSFTLDCSVGTIFILPLTRNNCEKFDAEYGIKDFTEYYEGCAENYEMPEKPPYPVVFALVINGFYGQTGMDDVEAEAFASGVFDTDKNIVTAD